MSNLVKAKIAEFRRNADACENWAMTVSYADIRQALLDIAKQWRDMADRFERIQVSLPLEDGS
jgi:hypothetical protein